MQDVRLVFIVLMACGSRAVTESLSLSAPESCGIHVYCKTIGNVYLLYMSLRLSLPVNGHSNIHHIHPRFT